MLLSAGSLVPADALVLEAKDLFVSEAVLTGESFPVEKQPGLAAPDAPLAERDNCVFRAPTCAAAAGSAWWWRPGGTRLRRHRPAADAAPAGDRVRPGHPALRLRLLTTMLVMVLLVFAAHVLWAGPPVETLLFSIALAVGLSPELLPAILSVNLAARRPGDGRARRAGAQAQRHREPGQHGRAVHRQDGHPDRGRGQLEGAYDAAGAPSAERARAGGAQRRAARPAWPTRSTKPSSRRAGTGAPRRREARRDPLRLRAQARSASSSTPATARGSITKGAFTQVLETCTRVRGTARRSTRRSRAELERASTLGRSRASACWRWPPGRIEVRGRPTAATTSAS